MFVGIEIIGLTLSTLGEVLLGGTVLMVHYKMRKDRSIDAGVIKEISLEQIIGGGAIILIIVGYLLQINFFEHLALNGV